MDTSIDEKVRENRLRRMARRQGLALLKSRARDERSLTYDHYALVDELTRFGVNYPDPLGRGYPFPDLDEVEEWLTSDQP